MHPVLRAVRVGKGETFVVALVAADAAVDAGLAASWHVTGIGMVAGASGGIEKALAVAPSMAVQYVSDP